MFTGGVKLATPFPPAFQFDCLENTPSVNFLQVAKPINRTFLTASQTKVCFSTGNQ